MPHIRLENITMRFGDITAVSDIDLEIRDGEYVTILGPSGCGKTTLIKIVAGILRPTDGKIFVDGKDVTKVPLEDRDTGYVFQNIALFPHMTIRGNAEYGPKVHSVEEGQAESTADEYLRLVDMLDKAGHFPKELSGGDQQKAALARALASGSRMLMLDEPLSALDARVRMELRYEIRRIVKRLGITVLHVTHDQEEAMSVSDRIILMRKGRIFETGTPLDMYRSPKSIFAAYFIGETNLMECTVESKRKGGGVILRLRNDVPVNVSKSKANVGEIAILSVRPEHVYTATDGLRAQVRDVVFMGTYWRVRTEAESQDYVDYNIPADSEVPETGEQVYLVFNKKASRVFKRPKEGLTEAIKLE